MGQANSNQIFVEFSIALRRSRESCDILYSLLHSTLLIIIYMKRLMFL